MQVIIINKTMRFILCEITIMTAYHSPESAQGVDNIGNVLFLPKIVGLEHVNPVDSIDLHGIAKPGTRNK